MANKTAQDIYGYAEDILSFDGADIGIPGLEESRTIEWIADLDKQLFEEFYERGIMVPQEMSSHYGVDAVAGTYLDGNASDTVAAAATSMLINDSDALATSGAGVIYDNNQFDIFTHTGNSSGSVTGIPATGSGSLNFAHEDGNAVERLYPLPSDFGRMRPSRRTGVASRDHDGVMIDGYGYREIPTMPSGYSFSLYKNSSGSWFLWIPQGTSGQIMNFYDLAPNTIDEVSDTISWATPYHWYHVWGLVGLFRKVQDEDYDMAAERIEQLKVVNQAISKRSAGKPILGSAKFFNRTRL